MRLLFYREDGSPQMDRQYTGPGRWYIGQDAELISEFRANEGDVRTFHVGHGVVRHYIVAAIDNHTALLQRV